MSGAVAPSFTVRGACPTLFEPFVAQDGLLVRLALVGGAIDADQLAVLAVTAGPKATIEITNRANLQVRGLDESRWHEVADACAAIGLSDSATQVRVVADPLWGLGDGLFDPTELLADVAALMRSVPGVEPKTGLLVDSGGAAHLRARSHPLAVGAVLVDDTVRLQVAVCESLDDAAGRGSVPTVAVADASAVAASFLSGRDPLHDVEVVSAVIEPAAGAVSLVGHGRTAGGQRWVGAHVPLARAATRWFGEVMATPSIRGHALRLTTRGGFVVVDGEKATQSALAEQGAIVDPNDPGLSVVTCIGSTGCEAALSDTMRDADALIDELRTAQARPARRIHLSGCGKQCASRDASDLHRIATGHGYVDLDEQPRG